MPIMRLLQCLQCACYLAGFLQSHDQDVTVSPAVRTQLGRPPKGFDGFLITFLSHQEEPQGMVYISVIRTDAQCLPQEFFPFFVSILFPIEVGQIDMDRH